MAIYLDIKIEDSQKHETNIYLGKDGSTALERSETNATGEFKPGLLALNPTLIPSAPYKTNSVNKITRVQ